jgi:hypothetical protein
MGLFLILTVLNLYTGASMYLASRERICCSGVKGLRILFLTVQIRVKKMACGMTFAAKPLAFAECSSITEREAKSILAIGATPRFSISIWKAFSMH